MIYVITHKVIQNTNPIDFKHCCVLHVGTNKECLNSYLRDDTGDNISFKNPNFCELTGLYWIWKNGKEREDDITGLLHYRRFFTTSKDDFKYKYFNMMPRSLEYTKIQEALNSNDVIIPQKIFIIGSIRSFYGKFHNISDLDKVRESVRNTHPDYLGSFDKIMKAHRFIYGNMIICKKRILDNYSEWLFDVLFDLENTLQLSKDDYQSRIYGFLAERLLQVWLDHNGMRYIEYPVYNTEKRTLNIFDVTTLRLNSVKRKIIKGDSWLR